MNVRRVVIAGVGSGVGKTTIATGIMALLSRQYRVQAFKVGPDFIDPMYHSAATGRPSRNLDSFFMDGPTLENLFGWASRDADIAIIEGVRGLYDGLTSTGDVGSTAEIAKMLDASVILVLNARSLAKSAAAQVLGFKMLDRQVRLEGVILNQVSGPRHRQKAIEAVEQLTSTPVIGVVERRNESFPERHLGLVTMPERDAAETIATTKEYAAGVDLDQLMAAAENRGERSFPEACPFIQEDGPRVKVGVPRDRAFSFYYPENIESMRAAGAEIVEFHPTDGDGLPEADSYYLGGGYPEVYASRLSDNTDFLDGLKTVSDQGRLVYGECGGLMVLCTSILDGRSEHPMAGVFESKAELTLHRQGLAYVMARATADNFVFQGAEIRGHEFHYSKLVPLPRGPYAYDVKRGTGIDGNHDGILKNHTVGTYMHQHALANKEWGRGFIRATIDSLAGR
ncbi:MAG TPA: cobyrinate a,c-diamide synthase [Methanomassiliicoccales archaeon]|nr:cobyrinate a,c-diamide synthase [Methanomassiliicoccales archaeon]